jgi:hypothetical protein
MYIYHAFVRFFVFATDRLQDNIFDHYNSFYLFYSNNRVIVIIVINPASIICFFASHENSELIGFVFI